MDVSDETLRALNPELDARDFALLCTRARAYAARTGPQVGDSVTFPNGYVARLTHDSDDRIQTTSQTLAEDASFHLHEDGVAEFSGSLDPHVSKTRLSETGEQPRRFWMFHHGEVRPHNRIYVVIHVRMFTLADITLDEKRAMYRRHAYVVSSNLCESNTSQWTEDDWIRALDLSNGWRFHW